jgi:LmbE family N-acetylglucosaminyl deacetylase
MSFRAQLRPLKRRLGLIIEYCWRLALRAAAAVTRPNATRWSSSGGQQVLVVAPHPDDEAIGCAGTVLLHVQSADPVWVAVATDGGQSRAVADDADVRRREAGVAARLLRVDRLEWIGLPEGECSVFELQRHLAALIQRCKPLIIYAPSRIDFHPEHFKVAHALALALQQAGVALLRDIRVRIYQIQVPLNPLITNLVADISSVQAQCEAALRAYASQAGSVQCAYRQRRYSATWHGIAGVAEEFWELSAQRYIDLHHAPPAAWPKVFRGLRYFPLTDPLAYLAGLGERRRMRASFCGN